jgi:RNA polymerase sigma-70 factor (ECF subfamily)
MQTSELAQARERFLDLVADVRPDLHRYASRLVGSAVVGEDVVQDTLAKAFYALSLHPEVPALRPWLFRIARNAAIDHIRRDARAPVREDDGPEVDTDDMPSVDPLVVRAALQRFLSLPVRQRSAVILKDVLGEPLEEVAAHLDTSVEAVKALLVRGRAALRAAESAPSALAEPTDRAALHRYVALFNARDWVGVQALLREEVRLDLVSKSQRQGAAVAMYFGRYAQETELTFRAVVVEGRDAVGVFRAGTLVYVVLVAFDDGRVREIRDFRYVPYLARELEPEAIALP